MVLGLLVVRLEQGVWPCAVEGMTQRYCYSQSEHRLQAALEIGVFVPV
jgi:hypothetical protein